jgi:hypothetical protein
VYLRKSATERVPRIIFIILWFPFFSFLSKELFSILAQECTLSCIFYLIDPFGHLFLYRWNLIVFMIVLLFYIILKQLFVLGHIVLIMRFRSVLCLKLLHCMIIICNSCHVTLVKLSARSTIQQQQLCIILLSEVAIWTNRDIFWTCLIS